MADPLGKDIHTPVGDAPVIPVLIMVTGAYLTWFGVHYWRSDTKWPTDPIKAVLQGKSIPVADRTTDNKAIELLGQTAGSAAAAVGTTPTGTAPTGTTPTVGVSQTYNHANLMDLWTGNGGDKSTADLAAAIALAESSGVAGTTSSNPDGGTNVGLWQLDTKGVGAGYTVDQLKDPAKNAQITIMATSNGTNWGPWETWHTGAYKQFL